MCVFVCVYMLSLGSMRTLGESGSFRATPLLSTPVPQKSCGFFPGATFSLCM